MKKYHVNPSTGEPGICKSFKNKCPFDGENEHFESLKDAENYIKILYNDGLKIKAVFQRFSERF